MIEAVYLRDRFQKSLLRKTLEYCYVFCKIGIQLNKASIEIARAPEPSDVLWENLSFGTVNKLVTRVFTKLATFMAIAAGFGITILIYWGQVQNSLDITLI